MSEQLDPANEEVSKTCEVKGGWLRESNKETSNKIGIYYAFDDLGLLPNDWIQIRRRFYYLYKDGRVELYSDIEYSFIEGKIEWAILRDGQGPSQVGSNVQIQRETGREGKEMVAIRYDSDDSFDK